MKTVTALIIPCSNEEERIHLADALHSVIDSARLQGVVLQKSESTIWTWDPWNDLANTAASIGIAVACKSKKEFDFLFDWLQERVKDIRCVTGMTDFPSVAYLPTDPRYLRESLPQ